MKLSDQVCSLEQAQKLKELGVTQVSWCHWAKEVNTGNEIRLFVNGVKPFIDAARQTVSFSAFTVAELGVMLPTLGFEFSKLNNGNGEDVFWLSSQYWRVSGVEFQNKSEAICRAEMLIYLLEHNKVSVDEVNKNP